MREINPSTEFQVIHSRTERKHYTSIIVFTWSSCLYRFLENLIIRNILGKSKGF